MNPPTHREQASRHSLPVQRPALVRFTLVASLPSLMALLPLWAPAPALAQAPIVTSINPKAAITDSVIQVEVCGTNFSPCPGATVTLHQDGAPDIVYTFSGNCDDCARGVTFGLQDAPLGLYDVVFTRADGESGTLPAAFRIVANPGLKIRQIGAWGGSVDAVFIDDSGPQRMAYIGSGVNMVILDVTDPGQIVELGSVRVAGIVHDIVVRDGYAFVASDSGVWFTVVDVSDPTAPQIVWTAGDLETQSFVEVDLFNDRAYFGFSSARDAYTFTIADPANPLYRGRCLEPYNDLVISGNYAYTINRRWNYGFLRIVDLSEEDCHGSLLAQLYIPELESASASGTRIALDAAEEYAYICCKCEDGISRVLIVDVSDVQAPFLADIWTDSLFEGNHWIYDVAVSGDRLYVADWDGFDVFNPPTQDPYRSLVILDITDPTTPTTLGEYWVPPAGVTGLSVVGTTVYLQNDREGLIILDCSDPANCVRQGGYHSPAVFQQGALGGDTLYVTDRRYGVSILDVADPGSLTLAGTWETGSTGNWGIDQGGGLVYVAAGWAGLQVLDVADPAVPTLAGEFPFPHVNWARALGLELDDDIVRVGTVSQRYLVNFDVSDLANIVDVGALGIPLLMSTIKTNTDSITFVGEHLDTYNATVNNSDPADPQLISYGYGPRDDLHLEGHLLYTVNDFSVDKPGLQIFDVSDPYAQTLLSYYPSLVSGQHTVSVVVDGDIAFAGRDGGPLEAYDVSDPSRPALLAFRGGGCSGCPPSLGPTPVATIRDLIVDGPILYAVTSHSQQIGAGVLSYLVYVPGDLDNDGDKDLGDFAALQRCFGGDGVAPTEATCLIADFDEDNDVDLDDFSAFADALTGPATSPAGPTGACCLADGTCADNVTEPYCLWTLGGEYQGDDTTCATLTCPPTGACCLAYGSHPCVEQTEFACLGVGGTYQGDYTTCGGVVCPFGACCDPGDGTCTEETPTACAAAGGVYQGDATTCGLIDCPFGQYSNEIAPMTSVALAGAGLQIADDMTLEGTGARDLVYLDLRVYGNGGGDFDVTAELWTDCPGNGGTLIPDTTFDWLGVPDSGYVYELVVDPLSPAVTIPDTVWMVATFTTPESGWIIAGQAETGFTEDRYGWLDPWDCNRTFTSSYAGLWANLRCVEGGGKSRGDDQDTRLSIERIETPVSIEAVE